MKLCPAPMFEIDSGVLLREEKNKAGRESALAYRKRTEDYTYQTLTPEAAHKHLKGFKVFIDPESDHKGVSYQHLGEEFIYVLKGKIEVMVVAPFRSFSTTLTILCAWPTTNTWR